jgi:hypothetical protein
MYPQAGTRAGGRGYSPRMSDAPDPTKEGFGEASLGEAQAENPAKDPEMIDEPSEGHPGGGESGTPEEYTGGHGDEGSPAEGGAERYGGDQDAEGTAGGEEPQPDQAEG